MTTNLIKNSFKTIIDLGVHSYADSFIPSDKLGYQEPMFPLQLVLDDHDCINTKYRTNELERYNLYPYSYTSANSKFSRNHWDSFYKDVVMKSFNFVTEIGCNDGYLLKKFKTNNNNTLGIDASSSICEETRINGLNVINELFTKNAATSIKERYGYSDLIIANNVVNHSNDILDFLCGIELLLDNNGVFVFEVPYWKYLIDSGHFDQIYHEHVSYFTVKSLKYLLEQIGLKMINFSTVDYHGVSLRVFAAKHGKESPRINEQIIIEEKDKLFDIETYSNFQSNIQRQRDKFLAYFYQLREVHKNVPIIAVGAAAKANTFLTYYNLGNGVIDYITDSSPLKIGKYTPLTRIKIVEDSIFSSYDSVLALILSWNITTQLKESILKYNPNIKFINAGI